jgi:chemotaxis methyl-accepting protein methylase
MTIDTDDPKTNEPAEESPPELLSDPWLDYKEKPTPAKPPAKKPRASKKSRPSDESPDKARLFSPDKSIEAKTSPNIGPKIGFSSRPKVGPNPNHSLETAAESEGKVEVTRTFGVIAELGGKAQPLVQAPLAAADEKKIDLAPDTSELELIRQAGAFFFRAGSPRGQKRFLAATRSRGEKLSISAAKYLTVLRKDPEEWDIIWDLVDREREDSFFRFQAQFDLLSKLIEEKSITAPERKLRLLSVGCGRGFEPYSLSMAMAWGRLAAKGWDLAIKSSDLSDKIVAGAKRAEFQKSDLDWLDSSTARHWFTLTAGGWRFKAELGPPVSLFKYNPANPGGLAGLGGVSGQIGVASRTGATESAGPVSLEGDRPAELSEPFDVIFCRGLSFDCPDHLIRLLAREITNQLAPGGLLFLAPGEFWPADREIGLEERDGVFYGRKAESIGKIKQNVLHVPKRKARTRERSRDDQAESSFDPGRQAIVDRFQEIFLTDPDAARDLALEAFSRDSQPSSISENLLMMLKVEEALGREVSAAAIKAVLERL